MNALDTSSASFEEARRRHLVEATIEAVADVGFKAASLSQIAKRANVSTGLYAHYFRDKDGLLEATLRYLAARLSLALRLRLKTATTPRERLHAIVEATLGDEEFDRRTSAVWLAFWGQIAHSERFQRIQYAYQRRLHTTLRHAFKHCVPVEQAELYATMAAGLIDGLWLQSHAYRENALATRARRTVYRLIDVLIEAPSDVAALLSPVPSLQPIDVIKPREPAADAEKEGAKKMGRITAVAAEGLRDWVALGRLDRAAVLRKCADLIESNSAELARLCVAISRRSVATELDFFIPRSVAALRLGADAALLPVAVSHDLGRGTVASEIRAIDAVVAAKAHRSAPLFDIAHAIGYALGQRGGVIIRVPADGDTLASHLRRLLTKAGVPAGAVCFLCDGQFDALLSANRAVRLHHTCWERVPEGTFVKSAAVLAKDADVERGVAAILSAQLPYRRTPDLSEVVVFVEHEIIGAVEHASTVWCTKTFGDARSEAVLSSEALQAVGASVREGAEIVWGRQPDSPSTILRLSTADSYSARANLFAPVLSLVSFDDDACLSAILQRDSFASLEVFASDLAVANRIARRCSAPISLINAYQGMGEHREYPRQSWVADVGVPSRRIIAIGAEAYDDDF